MIEKHPLITTFYSQENCNMSRLYNFGLYVHDNRKTVVVFAVASLLFSVGLLSQGEDCLLYTSPSPRDVEESRMPSSA